MKHSSPGEDAGVVPIVPADAQGVARAADMIEQGRVVAFPTESTYGLAAAWDQPLALDRLCVIKGRCSKQPLSLLVRDRKMLVSVSDFDFRARGLADLFWPGALTLVLPARAGVDSRLVNSSGGIGVRISSDDCAQALVTKLGYPITATSANEAGQPPAQRAACAALAGVSLVLDDGVRAQQASTVLDLTASHPALLRDGAIPAERLYRELSKMKK